MNFHIKVRDAIYWLGGCKWPTVWDSCSTGLPSSLQPCYFVRTKFWWHFHAPKNSHRIELKFASQFDFLFLLYWWLWHWVLDVFHLSCRSLLLVKDSLKVSTKVLNVVIPRPSPSFCHSLLFLDFCPTLVYRFLKLSPKFFRRLDIGYPSRNYSSVEYSPAL